MKHIFRVFLLFCMVLMMLNTSLLAQEHDPHTRSGCDDQIQEQLMSIVDRLDYDAACETYESCNNTDIPIINCHTDVFLTLLAGCPADDSFCHDGAMLTATVIFVYEPDFGSEQASINYPLIADALAAYWSGNTQAAYENIQTFINSAEWTFDYKPRFGYLMLGLLAAHVDETEIALRAFATTFNSGLDEPMTWYLRAPVLRKCWTCA